MIENMKQRRIRALEREISLLEMSLTRARVPSTRIMLERTIQIKKQRLLNLTST